MGFEFLTRFEEEVDIHGVSKAHAFLSLSKVLSGRAERHLQYIHKGARSDGVTCWLEVVNQSLWSYASPAAIRNAVNNLQNMFQQPREDEITRSERINDAAHRCRIFYDKVDKMTLLVNELLRSIQTVVARFWESKVEAISPTKNLFTICKTKGALIEPASNASLKLRTQKWRGTTTSWTVWSRATSTGNPTTAVIICAYPIMTPQPPRSLENKSTKSNLNRFWTPRKTAEDKQLW